LKSIKRPGPENPALLVRRTMLFEIDRSDDLFSDKKAPATVRGRYKCPWRDAASNAAASCSCLGKGSGPQGGPFEAQGKPELQGASG